ncbi:MAG: hypothetical protein IJV91_10940, partial [Kiritimatiellae bacterium]|nr:hypothetical protein [Kiritimatiellia bacterium]
KVGMLGAYLGFSASRSGMGQQLERSTHGEAPIDASIRLIQVGVSGLKIGTCVGERYLVQYANIFLRRRKKS